MIKPMKTCPKQNCRRQRNLDKFCDGCGKTYPCGPKEDLCCECAEKAEKDDVAAIPWPPSPPTGPDARPFSRADKAPDAYVKWRESDEGLRALHWMLRVAQAKYDQGERRIGVNYLSDLLRDKMKVRHANDWRPWIANDLVVLDPRLVDVIQRKTRRKPEPDPIEP